VIAGLLLALGSALAGSLSLLLKQRGAGAAPTVRARYPVRRAVGLFHSKWWTVGRAHRSTAGGRDGSRSTARR